MNSKSERQALCGGDGPFRPNVAALVLRREGEDLRVLLGERRDLKGAWQWPQGGLDPGERPEDGLRRELHEETGLADFEILYRFPFALSYRFPVGLGRRFRPYVGQTQQYFLVQPTRGQEPDLARATDREFRDLRWVPWPEVLHHPVWFKEAVYRRAVEHAEEVLRGWGWLQA